MNTIGRDTCIQSRNQHTWTSNNQPVLDHIFIRFGPASPTPPPPPGNPAWNSSPLGTNVILPDQNYKRSSWNHFHYPQVTRWGSFTCQRNLMAKWLGVVTLLPNMEEFHTCAGRMIGHGRGEPTHTLFPWRQGCRHPTRNECMGWFAQIDRPVKETWERWGLAEWRCDLAQCSRLP